MCYYAKVFEDRDDPPYRRNLSAATKQEALREVEAMASAIRVERGAIDLWCEGYEEFGREGRMVRTEAGLEWLN